VIEWLRTGSEAQSADQKPNKSVVQSIRKVSGSYISGLNSATHNTNIDVKQKFGTVQNSTIIGIDDNAMTTVESPAPKSE